MTIPKAIYPLVESLYPYQSDKIKVLIGKDMKDKPKRDLSSEPGPKFPMAKSKKQVALPKLQRSWPDLEVDDRPQTSRCQTQE